MGGPALRVGDGVVQIAAGGRHVAARPAAGQIPGPHESGQRCGGDVLGFGRAVAGMDQRHEFGGQGQLGQ